MKNPNGPSIEEMDDMADARGDEERAELSRITGQLRTLHKQAEAAGWSAVDDGRGDGAFKTQTMEAFNTAAWNYLPWILDKLKEAQELNSVDPREFATYKVMAMERNALWDAATEGALAIDKVLQTLILTDHVHVLRHPHLVESLHRALGTIKRATAPHQNS